MTIKKFHETYYTQIIEILDRFSQVEGQRIGRIIQDGNHYTMNNEKENIEILAKARMIRIVTVTDEEED